MQQMLDTSDVQLGTMNASTPSLAIIRHSYAKAVTSS